MLCQGQAWAKTIFPDGTVVLAHPQHGPEDVARAEALRYEGGVGPMTEDHDYLHQIVSWVVRGRSSRVVTGLMDKEFSDAEEGAVLAIQRYINAVRKLEASDG